MGVGFLRRKRNIPVVKGTTTPVRIHWGRPQFSERIIWLHPRVELLNGTNKPTPSVSPNSFQLWAFRGHIKPDTVEDTDDDGKG